jgi:hypothetical protein
MTKDPFEHQLETLFAHPPRFDDTARFALTVERRLTRAARWRADILSAAWISTIGAVLWALIASLDTPTGAVLAAQATAAVAAAQDLGGGWLLPALAVGVALGVLALEDQLARD